MSAGMEAAPTLYRVVNLPFPTTSSYSSCILVFLIVSPVFVFHSYLYPLYFKGATAAPMSYWVVNLPSPTSSSSSSPIWLFLCVMEK